MRIRSVLLIVVFAVFTFGGTFTCTSGDDHDHDDRNVHVPDAPPHQSLD